MWHHVSLAELLEQGLSPYLELNCVINLRCYSVTLTWNRSEGGDEAEIEVRLRRLQLRTENGDVEDEFRHLSSVNQMVDIESVRDAFHIKIGEFKHQFLSLETPRSTGMTI